MPLLIGGATTSAKHTAVKIAPQYHGPVIHVKDASKSVGVVDRLNRPEARAELDAQNRAAQEHERDAFGKRVERKLVPYAEAFERRLMLDWTDAADRRPRVPGHPDAPAIPLEQIVPFIDWSPFFMSWELKGKYPRIFDDPELGPRPRAVRRRPELLRRIVAEKRVTANAVYGFFPANSDGDDIVIYNDESRQTERMRLPDASAAVGARRPDVVPLAGRLHRPARDRARRLPGCVRRHGRASGSSRWSSEFERDHDDYNAIMSKALADRLAEALAEMLHKQRPRGVGLRPRRRALRTTI